ncbi:MAG: calcium-binding protein [Myxococcaceae bacterium]
MTILRSLFIAAFALTLLNSCTDAGLYATDGLGPNAPDRAVFEGVACVPLASGNQFPVKVLFAIQGGEGVPRDVVAQVSDALGALSQTYETANTTFSLVAYHSVATGLQGSFVDGATLQNALGKYNGYQEAGPVSVRSGLRLARSIIAGDVLTGCKGTVARTRYVVVVVMLSADTSCANQNFNAGISDKCNQVLSSGIPNADAECSKCELSDVTAQLKGLSEQYDVGEVSVQPVYITTTPDPLVVEQVAAIARAGGSREVQTDPANVKTTLGQLDFSSLQRHLTLKRLIAFNRNVVVRNGQMMLDSDEDGIPDDEEDALGTDKLNPDSDNDGLMDGLELKMGLKPQPGNVDIINGCNVKDDDDFDRLNNCEERVLGTDSCVSDTDGDGIPDVVELLSSTNPLVPEDLADDDRDGFSNVDEVQSHTDPHSADVAFRTERGYQYTVEDADPTPDGRACYKIRAYNISLMTSLRRPNPPYADIKQGTNDLYLYMLVGRDNDPRGTGVGSLVVRPVTYDPPKKRKPAGALDVVPDDFVVGD